MNCPICQSSAHKQLTPVNGFSVESCQDCSLIWIDNVSMDVLKKFYTKDYFESKDHVLGYANYLEDEKILRLNAKKLLDEITSCPQKILDVGCAYGFFLDEARKKWNAEVVGVELSQEAAQYAKTNLQLNVKEKPLLECQFAQESFDLISIIGVLEHLPDAIATLKECARILKPGGHLIVTTIDTKGLVRLYEIKPPEHLYYFSKKNLSLCLKKFGFHVKIAKNYWPYYFLNEAVCRAFRLLSKLPFRLEKTLSYVPFLETTLRVPTNEMLVVAQKSPAHLGR